MPCTEAFQYGQDFTEEGELKKRLIKAEV